MVSESKRTNGFAGGDATEIGTEIRVGQKAPEFQILIQDWSILNIIEIHQVLKLARQALEQ